MAVTTLYDNITGAETSNTKVGDGADHVITVECRDGGIVDIQFKLTGGEYVTWRSCSGHSVVSLGYFPSDATIRAIRVDGLVGGKARVLLT